jgi:replication factor A1
MEIKDLKPNSGNVDLVLTVVNKEEPRSFEKFGKAGRVCNAQVSDGSGEVKMTLWNEDVDSVAQGDKIHLQNGWCSEFKGEVQISSGKFGKIEIVEKGQDKTVLTNDPDILKGVPGSDGEMEEYEESEGPVDEEEFVE